MSLSVKPVMTDGFDLDFFHPVDWKLSGGFYNDVRRLLLFVSVDTCDLLLHFVSLSPSLPAHMSVLLLDRLHGETPSPSPSPSSFPIPGHGMQHGLQCRPKDEGRGDAPRGTGDGSMHVEARNDTRKCREISRTFNRLGLKLYRITFFLFFLSWES